MSKHKGVARDKSGGDSFPKGRSPWAGCEAKISILSYFFWGGPGAVGGVGGEWHGRGTAAQCPPPGPT